MNFQKILPKTVRDFLIKHQSKKRILQLANKTTQGPQIPKDSREYSLIAEQKILQSEEYRNILKNAIRKSSGGADEYQLGHSVPGLRYMAGNQYRTTLVFTLFFLPAWWAPWGLFCLMWMKQMG